MFTIEYINNGRFRVRLPDGTVTTTRQYEDILFFAFKEKDYMAVTPYYAECTGVFLCSPVPSRVIDCT